MSEERAFTQEEVKTFSNLMTLRAKGKIEHETNYHVLVLKLKFAEENIAEDEIFTVGLKRCFKYWTDNDLPFECEGWIFRKDFLFIALLPGEITSKTIKQKINFNKCTFLENFQCALLDFNETVSFTSSTFSKEFDIGTCQFNKGISFSSVKFEGITKFRSIVFCQNTNWDTCTFEKETSFKSLYCAPPSNTEETENSIPILEFYSTSFLDTVTFESSGGIFYFTKTFIKETSSIIHEEPLSIMNLRVRDQGQLNLSNNYITSYYLDSANFAEGISLNIDGFNTKKATIRVDSSNHNCKQINVKNSKIKNILFNKGNYQKFTFDNCTWHIHKPWNTWPSTIRGIDHESERPQKDQTKKEFARQLKEKYISLKKAAENSGDKILAAEFSYWELHFAQKEEFGLVRFLFGVTSGYGHSILLPFVCWVGLVFILPLIYLFANKNPFIICPSDPWTIFTYSLLNGTIPSLDPSKLSDNLNSHQLFWITVTSIIQKAISIYLIYEFGKAIRRKVATN